MSTNQREYLTGLISWMLVELAFENIRMAKKILKIIEKTYLINTECVKFQTNELKKLINKFGIQNKDFLYIKLPAAMDLCAWAVLDGKQRYL